MARAAPITIAGCGILGLSVAWEIARRGAPVRVVDAAHIGAGSSGGTVGALAPHAPENWNPKKQFQLDSLIAAGPFWAGVAQAGGVDPGYARTGRIQPVLPDSRIDERLAAARIRWPDGAAMALTARPETPLLPDGAMFLTDTLTARLNPRAALAALAAAIRRTGGVIEEGVALPRDQPGPVIWATGAAGLDELGRDLDRPVGQGIKGQSALLRFSAPTAPQIFADGVHIVPHADGTVGIGSTTERAFADLATDAQLDTVIAKARAICPALAHAPVVLRWAGARPRARSRAPVLGEWPGRPGHFVLNGGFKIGFGMVPGLARVMADLVLDGADRIPEDFRLHP